MRCKAIKISVEKVKKVWNQRDIIQRSKKRRNMIRSVMQHHHHVNNEVTVHYWGRKKFDKFAFEENVSSSLHFISFQLLFIFFKAIAFELWIKSTRSMGWAMNYNGNLGSNGTNFGTICSAVTATLKDLVKWSKLKDNVNKQMHSIFRIVLSPEPHTSLPTVVTKPMDRTRRTTTMNTIVINTMVPLPKNNGVVYGTSLINQVVDVVPV